MRKMRGMHLFQGHLVENLRTSLIEQWPQGGEWACMQFEPLKAKGLAHDHVRLVGTGWLARIPKQSQMQLKALENLIYQQACFDRASPAGHAPYCRKLVTPCPVLPRGALIVKEIEGRSAVLPQDLPLMARSMAALHRLPLPQPEQSAPLVNAADPLLAMWEEVSTQAAYLSQAQLSPQVATRIHTELARLHSLCKGGLRPLKRLIAFDGHPGNFVISQLPDGHEKAYLVDLEKCRYSYPSFDLAHATLYTSTTRIGNSTS